MYYVLFSLVSFEWNEEEKFQFLDRFFSIKDTIRGTQKDIGGLWLAETF